jgi:hypothetical protein
VDLTAFGTKEPKTAGSSMGRPSEAAKLCLIGDSPSQIAYRMGISVSTVLGYLYRQAGEGKIQRSDIILSIDRETRRLAEQALKRIRGAVTPQKVVRWIRKHRTGVSEDDVRVYLKLMDAGVLFGDLYQSIREIERFLHSTAKEALAEAHGEAWWRAVPEEVRLDCAERMEKDERPAADKYAYTTFIHLKKIFEKNWAVLSPKLPAKYASRKREFLSELDRLNRIRNAVMHPVKGMPLDDEAFSTVRRFQRMLTTKPEPRAGWGSLLANARVDTPVQ